MKRSINHRNTRKQFYPIFVLCLCLLLVFQGSVFSQDSSQTLNLNQMIDSALQKNHLLQANQKNVLIKQVEIENLKTNYQPTITTSATFSYWKFLLPNKQRLLGDALTDLYTDISVYQTLYDWGENKLKKSLIEDEILLNEEVARQIRNTIIWGVADAYFDALKAVTEISVHHNALNQLKSHLQFSENLYKIGKVSGVDLLKINLQISIEEKNLQKSKSVLNDQIIKLKRLCFLNEIGEFNIENISEKLYIDQKDIYFEPTPLYNEVALNHPVLLAANKKINLESAQKELYTLQSRPEIYSYGISSWEHGYIPFGKNFNYNIGVGIRYTIPYWGGSSYKAKLLQSDYRIEQISDEFNEAFLEIKKEIDLVLNTINDIKSEVINNDKIINLATETLNNSLIIYQAGQGTIIDILDAQSVLTETLINKNKLMANYLQALVKLNYLTGNDNYPF